MRDPPQPDLSITHTCPDPIPCELCGHADWHASDLGGGSGVVRPGLQGRRADADYWPASSARGRTGSAAPAGRALRRRRSFFHAWPRRRGCVFRRRGRLNRTPSVGLPGQFRLVSASGLGTLSLDPVTEAAERCRWEAMIETHHPGRGVAASVGRPGPALDPLGAARGSRPKFPLIPVAESLQAYDFGCKVA